MLRLIHSQTQQIYNANTFFIKAELKMTDVRKHYSLCLKTHYSQSRHAKPSPLQLTT